MLLSGTAEEDSKSLCGPEWLHVAVSCSGGGQISLYVSLSGYVGCSWQHEGTINY